MATVFRWLLRLFTGAAALTLLGAVLVYYLASRSLPEYTATLVVEGPADPVEIVRDTANVPHIFGQSDADVYFGLGFAHAQDRLWQMTLMRRTVQGRLSEMFGPRTRRFDELMRRLDLYPLATQAVEEQDDYTDAALRAYAAGVNAWLAEVNERALGRGAPEFFLFSPEIAPWQPADSIAILKLLALQLSPQISNEVLRARTSLLIDVARVADILPDSPGAGIAALPEYAALFPSVRRSAEVRPEADPLYPVPRRPLTGASNVWTAAPSRAASGGALLANDPHLPLAAPAPFYLARLELTSGGVIGGTIPGLPAMLVGRTDTFGWGVAAAHADDQDLFVEELHPDDPTRVRGPEGWEAMDTRPSILRIKDAPPVTLALQWTANGPVLPQDHFGLSAITPPGHVVSLSWTALTGSDTSMSAALALTRARGIDEAMAAGAGMIAPTLNLVLADSQSIAMKTVGALARRDASHQTRGRMPSPGWLEQNRWHGTLAYAANPEFRDPAGGILGNTNNKTVERPFPQHVSFDWGDTQRVRRWRRLMQVREVHTRESFIEAQLDTVSVSARTLLPLIFADLLFTGEAAPAGTLERRKQEALDLLGDWNGEMNEHMPEPLIYSAWMRALQTRIIRDELGRLSHEFTHVEPVFLERVYRDVDGASIWCDVIQSEPRETCTEMAELALGDALVWLDETYGGALQALRWGDVHEARHDHMALGTVPLLSWIVNIRQSTSGGDQTLLRGVSSGRDPAPFVNVHAAAYRGIYDFADPDASVFVISTGQSGHPLSRHYDDLGELWRRGEYIPMSLDPDLARAAAVGITVLTPR